MAIKINKIEVIAPATKGSSPNIITGKVMKVFHPLIIIALAVLVADTVVLGSQSPTY